MDNQVIEIQTQVGRGEFVTLCLLIVIWSVIMFLVGMSYGQPDCEIEIYRTQEGDELVSVCVVGRD